MKTPLQFLFCLFLLAIPALHAMQTQQYDVLIRGGRIVDGTGNSWFRADVALRGDTIVAIGTNALETQTNYFLNHWLPNLNGGTVQKKRKWFPGETAAAAKIVIVDPRRSATVAICEQIAGKENVLHLDIEPGSDTALFNTLLTYVVDQGWHDKDYITKNTRGFDDAMKVNRMSLEDGSKATGIAVAKLRQVAEWAYKPKASGHRPRTFHAYEKGIIWGNDNYVIQSALVSRLRGNPGLSETMTIWLAGGDGLWMQAPM